MSGETMEIGGREIEITHPDKVMFPDAGITKFDLATYYARIAETALPHFRDLPVTMKRYPDGIDGESFFQKNAPDYFPDWIARADVPKEDGTVSHVVVEEAATLVYLAQQGCITPHIGIATVKAPRKPVRLVFDLDPSDGDFGKVQEVARALREELEGRDLPSFVKTTGSRGLHIVLSLDASVDVDDLRPFARDIAARVADRAPDLATTEQRKDKRGNRVLVDTFRTAYGQTSVAPYAVRARPGAPVATPIRWDEALSSDMTPTRYDIKAVFRRLGQTGDPWEKMHSDPIDAARLIEEE
jgi:bifunctional non-homologous end joining protein LigD